MKVLQVKPHPEGMPVTTITLLVVSLVVHELPNAIHLYRLNEQGEQVRTGLATFPDAVLEAPCYWPIDKMDEFPAKCSGPWPSIQPML